MKEMIVQIFTNANDKGKKETIEKKQKQNAKDEFNELHFISKLIFCCIFVLGACIFFNRHIKLCLQILMLSLTML